MKLHVPNEVGCREDSHRLRARCQGHREARGAGCGRIGARKVHETRRRAVVVRDGVLGVFYGLSRHLTR